MRAIKRIINPYQLHRAAREKDIKTADKLLAQKFSPNEYDKLGLTPLHYSLLYKSDAVTVRVLEAKANANAFCTAGYLYGKAMQPYVHKVNLSVIRLLAMYGATLDEIRFNEKTVEEVRAINQAFQEGQNIYNLKTEQEQIIKTPSFNEEAFKEKSIKLQQALFDLSQKEDNAIFKNHYQQLAVQCSLLPMTNQTAASCVTEKQPMTEKFSLLSYLREKICVRQKQYLDVNKTSLETVTLLSGKQSASPNHTKKLHHH